LEENEIDQKINLAHNTYLKWKNTPNKIKKELCLNLAKSIEDDIFEIAKLQTIEM
jgi:acyl-CoA reductase-like NAD-dependent aldehyde dehydrogenase